MRGPVNGTTTVFVDDDLGREIAEYDGAGNVLRDYAYLPHDAGAVASLEATGNVNFRHYERLGSLVALSGGPLGAGSFISGWDAEPDYGGTGEFLGGVTFSYAGYYFDQETGLYHTARRYYAPSIGRFLSPDPIRQHGGANIYAYVGDDPLNATDPSGLCFEDACVVEGVGAGAVYAGASALIAAGVCVQTCGSIINSISSAFNTVFNSADPTVPPLPPGVGPGPYAGPSVPSGPSPRPTAGQQEAINAAGAQAGCHTCGTTDPGTQSGNWIGDHQPPTAINPPGNPQVYLPQCQGCSNTQGGLVRGLLNNFEAPTLK